MYCIIRVQFNKQIFRLSYEMRFDERVCLVIIISHFQVL